MNPIEILPTLCEMSITIAGFTAIVVSIRAQRAGGWDVEERLRILGILSVCGFVAVCAVLPFAISGLTQSAQLMWAVPLLVSGIACLVILILVIATALKGKFEFLIPSVTWTMMGSLGVLSIFSVLSGIGLFLPYSQGLLVLQL
ncbi:MAG: hypothetical protein ACI9BW_002361 [Gammaproteobacteria bacterium]|jgi:hypothetical protein